MAKEVDMEIEKYVRRKREERIRAREITCDRCILS